MCVGKNFPCVLDSTAHVCWTALPMYEVIYIPSSFFGRTQCPPSATPTPSPQKQNEHKPNTKAQSRTTPPTSTPHIWTAAHKQTGKSQIHTHITTLISPATHHHTAPHSQHIQTTNIQHNNSHTQTTTAHTHTSTTMTYNDKPYPRAPLTTQTTQRAQRLPRSTATAQPGPRATPRDPARPHGRKSYVSHPHELRPPNKCSHIGRRH